MPKQSNDELAKNFQDALASLIASSEGCDLLATEIIMNWPVADVVETYEEAGVLTQNRGLVVRLSEGSEVRLTITALSPAGRPW